MHDPLKELTRAAVAGSAHSTAAPAACQHILYLYMDSISRKRRFYDEPHIMIVLDVFRSKKLNENSASPQTSSLSDDELHFIPIHLSAGITYLQSEPVCRLVNG